MLLLLLSVFACRTKDGVVQDTSVLIVDEDGDGVPASEDCDDGDPAVYPGAEELCDGVDNDCDGEIDVGASDASLWTEDRDGDNYGDDDTAIEACEPPSEIYVAQGGDCDDLDPVSHPGAAERCDDIDNDCDGTIDNDLNTLWYADADTDGFGDAGSTLEDCDPGSGWVADNTDCDDSDPSSYPDAAEVCDGADNNCDGNIDEGVTTTYYGDADGDGWGDADSTTEACSLPDGHVARAQDCDDSTASVSPDATELCDGVDNDCDSDVDEDDAADADTFYQDSDSDGWGDGGSTTTACEAPSGYAEVGRDCNDSDAAVNPDAAEVCDSVDNDCNGYIDDEDPGLTDGDTWYIDTDSDGHGVSTYTTTACDQPTGYVADADDCDDSDATVSPSGTETCNGVDDDCDGDTDEDDASDVLTWYADSDGDSYGDASVSDVDCEQPSGYVADDTDCDDSDDSVYPGAREALNGLDDDCDSTVDEAWFIGSGGDGDLTVTSTVDLSADGSGSRTDADAVGYPVTAISGADLTVDSSVSGITAGDEVLILNLHGSDSAHSAVGTYEFADVASVSGSTITLSASVSETYGESSNADLSGQSVFVQRVPHYADVTVSSGGTLTTSGWDGEQGGVLAFRATGTVLVESGGLVSVDSLGYWGGETGTSSNCDAYQGESYAGEGEGDGDGACSSYNEYWGQYVANYGGGGAHITGGGGNHAGGATDGDSWTGGSATPPSAGDTYGSADLSTLFPGSGGGGVWSGGSTSGPGGDGGGIVFIAAFEIETEDSEAITSIGGTTPYWATGTWTYGAGGGAGGSIYLVADTMTLAADSIDAQGGFGESSHIRAGGDGGYGRIRLDYNDLNGNTQGSSGASTEEASVCEPDAGYSATP